MKNTNNYTNNSSDFSDEKNYDLFGSSKIDFSLPLQKRMEKYTNYLTPKISLRYSPNGNNDMSLKNLILNYDNAFNLNRINTSSQVEGDEALTIGLEFERKNNFEENIFSFRIGNVLKSKK